MSRKMIALQVGALTSLLMASTAVGAQGETSVHTSAFALSASGALTIDPVPSVDSNGKDRNKSIARFAAPGGDITANALNASASDKAASSVTDLQVAEASLKASAVRAECGDGKGSASLANASLGGRELAASPPPNTNVTVPGVASVILNKQTRSADGSLSVTALHVSIDGAQTVDVASVKCAKQVDEEEPPPSSGTPAPPEEKPGTAPRPTPVRAHLPVTH